MLEWVKSRFGLANPERRLRQAERLRAEGAVDQARQIGLEILRQAPDDVGTLCLLAKIAADARQTAEGLTWAKRAATADPRSAEARYVTGRLLEVEGRLPEAETAYREAVGFAPDDARMHNNLGCVLHMQGRLDAALSSYRQALELDPTQPEAIQNYASIVRDAGALEQAVAGYKRQVELNPDDAAALTNLANTYCELGYYVEALAAYERAIRADPDYAEAHFSRSLVLLIQGRYAEGWKEYEWRWRINTFNAPLRRFNRPMWEGGDVADGPILLHAEQGLGDTIQFVRYAALVARRCPSVILECQPELKSLLTTVKGVGSVVAQGEALPRFSAHAPLMSLPYLFGTTLDSVPWQGPYVHADPVRVAAWHPLVSAESSRLRVGLVWAGRPQHWDDRKRSIMLAMLAPLAQAGDMVFYSLQKGEGAAQAGSPPAGMRLLDLTNRIREFSDTAALIAHLDVVVAVDTSVAHLAGAMGAPVWLLLAHAPDWRYPLERSDNPWYPTMRLFRQDRDGDWSGPIGRVAVALKDLEGKK